MTENKQRKKEEFSNDILTDGFRALQDFVVNNLDASPVLDKLFAAKVISNNDMQELEFIKKPTKQCRRLLIILHKVKNPRTFIELREAIKTEESNSWIVETIDKKCLSLTSPAVQPQVNRVSSNHSLTPLNGDTGDVTELNRVIDDLRSDNAELKKENSRFLDENAKQKLDNERLSKDIATLTTEISKLLEENNRLKDDKKQSDSFKKSQRLDSVVSTNVDNLDGATGVVVSTKKVTQSTVDDPQKTSRDADVLVKPPLHDNPQLLFTLDQPPTDRDGNSRQVNGLVMLDRCIYVIYWQYPKVQVFDCDDRCKKNKNIRVEKMKSPRDMVGSSVTSQLFIGEWSSDVIWQVDSKTGVSDAFIKTGYKDTSLSLVENRLLVTSQDSLLVFDIFSGKKIKQIPLTKDITKYIIRHAIESNRDSFFVSHYLPGNNTVSEINSEGRVIRVFDNKQQLDCRQLALDSVGRLLVADWKNSQVVLLDEHLKYERTLIDIKRLDNARPMSMNYNKNNNRLTVGLINGHVKIFEY